MIDETLLSDSPGPEFDREKIERGFLIRARHRSWDEFRNGVVTSIRRDAIWVYYWTGYGNVANHYRISAKEVVNWEWDVYWTEDLDTVYHMGPAEEEDEEP